MIGEPPFDKRNCKILSLGLIAIENVITITIAIAPHTLTGTPRGQVKVVF